MAIISTQASVHNLLGCCSTDRSVGNHGDDLQFDSVDFKKQYPL